MAQTIPSGVWTVLDGGAQYQPNGKDIEVYQNSSQDVEAVVVGPYDPDGYRPYYRVNMVPDLGDFQLRAAGGDYTDWQGSSISGSWVA